LSFAWTNDFVFVFVWMHCVEQSAGLKSIGKAVTKGTKKIGRTLTNLADTPDKRAQERVAKMATPKARDGRRRKGNVKHKRASVECKSLGLDIGECTNSFFLQEIYLAVLSHLLFLS